MTDLSDIKKGAQGVVDDIHMQAPPQLIVWGKKIMDHPGTPWFFLGTGVEALGITVQYMYFDASFPILDFIAGFAIFVYLAWWQQKQNGGDDTDAEGDSDGEDEDEDNGTQD